MQYQQLFTVFSHYKSLLHCDSQLNIASLKMFGLRISHNYPIVFSVMYGVKLGSFSLEPLANWTSSYMIHAWIIMSTSYKFIVEPWFAVPTALCCFFSLQILYDLVVFFITCHCYNVHINGNKYSLPIGDSWPHTHIMSMPEK